MIKSNLVFNKELCTNSQVVRAQYNSLNVQRDVFGKREQAINADFKLNATALITRDFWRDVDSVTTRVFRNEAGMDMMNDLMGLASNIDIGKTVAISRIASDAGKVVRTISGKVPEDMDNTRYDYSGDPVPIFKSGYGRDWREYRGMQSEGFDPLLDDQANILFNLREDMATYLLYGDTNINVNGVYTARGITNHANTNQIDLSSAGLNIDLQTATPDEVVAFFNTDFAALLDNQNVFEEVDIWVSPAVRRNFSKPYSNASGFKGGTVEDYILQFSRVSKIGTNFLLTGNHFVGYVRSEQYLRPRVGQPVSTYAQPRNEPFDDYNFLVWGAMGLQIRKDFAGRSKVFNAYGPQTAL